MKILVTGGAGFLGSHLCNRLLSLGHKVICLDNLSTGTQKNIENLLPNPNFDFLHHDITLPIFLEVDGIFNFACQASPLHYQKDPTQTLKTSVLGAINLLGLAKRNGARILQASTSEIYGDPMVSPQREAYWGNVNPIGIRACYDEGKRAAETLFTDTHRQFGTDIRIARIFNTYGPKMALNDGRVVSNLIIQALQNKELTIYGGGNQTRSFCYVEDMIEGIILLFFKENLHSPLNLGNPHSITINELATEIIGLTHSKSKVNYLPLPEDDPLQRCPDISKAQLLLKWDPVYSRNRGLGITIDYFHKMLHNSNLI